MSNFRLGVLIRLGSLFLLGLMVLLGCSTTPGKRSNLSTATGTLVPVSSPTIVVSSPELALQDALNTIQIKYGISVPSQVTNWKKEVWPSEISGETQSYQYISGHWNAQVTYPQNMALESTVYTIDVRDTQVGFEWVGLIDAFGKVENVTAVTEEVPLTSTPSVTPVLPTETAFPTATPLPTQTPIPTISPKSTLLPIPCNAAEFIEDITIPDGSAFTPGTAFEKIWRLKNVGTCTWTDGYDLVFKDGNQMDGPNAIDLPGIVEPNQSIDISVRLKAPTNAGDYQGFWMLRDAGNVLFGVGDDADKPFWVNITVARERGNYDYDFAIDYCSAKWRTETRQIPCDDTTRTENGFVKFLSNPVLENRHENEPALWVHPNEKRYGWIEGSYPAFTIQSGDVFKAWVGCLEGYQRCNVTFYLGYETGDGYIHTLKSWRESYDGNITKIELSLSSLEGRTVHLILGMKANTHNVKDAQGFWFVPRIERWKSLDIGPE